MKLATITIAAGACLGCAWEPGHGFATLESASVVATFEPEASDPAITVSSLEIDVSAVDLEGSGSEPAHEHAHGEEAEAAAEEAAFSSIVTLHVDQTLDWLAGLPTRVASVTPTRELPETELLRALVSVTGVRMILQAQGADVTVDLPLELTLTGTLDFDVNRDAPERLELTVTIEQSSLLFEGVDLAALAPGNDMLTDPADPLLQPLIENLGASAVHVDFREAR